MEFSQILFLPCPQPSLEQDVCQKIDTFHVLMYQLLSVWIYHLLQYQRAGPLLRFQPRRSPTLVQSPPAWVRVPQAYNVCC